MNIPKNLESVTEMPYDWKEGFEEGYRRGFQKAIHECLEIVENPIRPLNKYGDLSILVAQAMAKRIKELQEDYDPEKPPAA